MTAYSFGNKWMGIIALKESPLGEQEPLHRMALRLNKAKVLAPYTLETKEQLSTQQLLRLMRRAELKARLRNDPDTAAKYRGAEPLIRTRTNAGIPMWLQRVIEQESADLRNLKSFAQSSVSRGSLDQVQRPGTRLEETAWSTIPAFTPAEEDALPTPSSLVSWLEAAEIKLSEKDVAWISIACVHASYLYECRALNDYISSDALSLLDELGNRAMQVAILDIVRFARKDFVSAEEIHGMVSSASYTIDLLASTLMDLNEIRLGAGEAKNQTAKATSGPARTVARQVIGALCLTQGGISPVYQLVRKLGFRTRENIDWKTELAKLEKSIPSYIYQSDGPDHARTYRAKVSVGQRHAEGEGSSKKGASDNAARNYLKTYFPNHSIGSTSYRARRPVGVLSQVSKGHVECVKNISSLFGVDNYALLSQCFIHSSWAYENARMISAAHQRPNNVLAAEGSFILGYLSCHHHVLSTLRNSLKSGQENRSYRQANVDTMAELADSLEIAPGILLGNGERTAGSSGVAKVTIQVDVMQAVIAAAWRASPGALNKRQPQVFQGWLDSLDTRLDPHSQLSIFTSSLGISTIPDMQMRGPDHARSFRSVLSITADEPLVWVGTWESSKKRARRSTAQGILELVLLMDENIPEKSSLEGKFYRLVFEKQIEKAAKENPLSADSMLMSNLSIDSLINGRFVEFREWALQHQGFLTEPSETAVILQRVYKKHVQANVKRRVSIWTKENCAQTVPTRSGEEFIAANDSSTYGVARSTAAIAYALEAVLTAPPSIAQFFEEQVQRNPLHLEITGYGEVDTVIFGEATHRVLSFVIEHGMHAAVQANTMLSVYVHRFDATLDFVLSLPSVDLEQTLSEVRDITEVLAPWLKIDAEGSRMVISTPFFEESDSPLVHSTMAIMDEIFNDDWFVQLHRALEAKLSRLEDWQKARKELTSSDEDLRNVISFKF